ncbi:MAG TPA: HAMP domain-containing sensor histidine kinase [Acidimicrobiia bacterium]
MSSGETVTPRRPSRWWLALAAICAALSAAGAISAILVQRSSAQPIGEGEVFIADASEAASIIEGETDLDAAVRLARNALEIEAVSTLDADGVVTASTSEPLVGVPVRNELIAYGANGHRFMALAAAIDEDLWLDGVVEWPATSVLYQVVSPLDDGSSLLLHYDVSKLLARRTQPGEIQPEALQLLGLAAIFGLFGGAILFGHSRAARRYREVELESELLRAHSEELRAANKDLDRARHQAEEALALAEEKIRIRSEFVLMINHELRTPLTSVVTGAELLRSGTLSDRDRRVVLDAMVTDGARLQEIIDQILAVARIENRGLSYELTEVPLGEVCEALRSAHPASTLILPPDGSDTFVRTDVRALGLVVASLVDNAFTHGAQNVTVECMTRSVFSPQLEVGERPEDAVFIMVSDDGPGIDIRFLPRIFEKFEKSSFSSGTGLGLYMARMIIEALEGSLSVHSSPTGSTFRIALPLVSVRQPVATP